MPRLGLSTHLILNHQSSICFTFIMDGTRILWVDTLISYSDSDWDVSCIEIDFINTLNNKLTLVLRCSAPQAKKYVFHVRFGVFPLVFPQ